LCLLLLFLRVVAAVAAAGAGRAFRDDDRWGRIARRRLHRGFFFPGSRVLRAVLYKRTSGWSS
jgi:hypothetical protein